MDGGQRGLVLRHADLRFAQAQQAGRQQRTGPRLRRECDGLSGRSQRFGQMAFTHQQQRLDVARACLQGATARALCDLRQRLHVGLRLREQTQGDARLAAQLQQSRALLRAQRWLIKAACRRRHRFFVLAGPGQVVHGSRRSSGFKHWHRGVGLALAQGHVGGPSPGRAHVIQPVALLSAAAWRRRLHENGHRLWR